MYTFGRIWFEALRVDPASEIFGIRFNLLLSVVLCIAGAIWFVWLGGAHQSRDAASSATDIRRPSDAILPPNADAGAV